MPSKWKRKRLKQLATAALRRSAGATLLGPYDKLALPLVATIRLDRMVRRTVRGQCALRAGSLIEARLMQLVRSLTDDEPSRSYPLGRVTPMSCASTPDPVPLLCSVSSSMRRAGSILRKRTRIAWCSRQGGNLTGASVVQPCPAARRVQTALTRATPLPLQKR